MKSSRLDIQSFSTWWFDGEKTPRERWLTGQFRPTYSKTPTKFIGSHFPTVPSFRRSNHHWTNPMVNALHFKSQLVDIPSPLGLPLFANLPHVSLHQKMMGERPIQLVHVFLRSSNKELFGLLTWHWKFQHCGVRFLRFPRLPSPEPEEWAVTSIACNRA